MRFLASLLCLLVVLTVSGCSSLNTGVYKEGIVTESGEPAYVTVQHCLISYKGATPNATRSVEEAELLANELYQRVQAGEDFDEIIVKNTDDSPPGVFRIANVGQEYDMKPRITSRKVFARQGLVPAFGDVGFSLEVGEFGMAPYDPQKSPFGWHIIKRTR